VQDAITIVLEDGADRVGWLGPLATQALAALLCVGRKNLVFVRFKLLANRHGVLSSIARPNRVGSLRAVSTKFPASCARGPEEFPMG
jgi:hypothetical protein